MLIVSPGRHTNLQTLEGRLLASALDVLVLTTGNGSSVIFITQIACQDIPSSLAGQLQSTIPRADMEIGTVIVLVFKPGRQTNLQTL